jgi:hypothetical protein
MTQALLLTVFLTAAGATATAQNFRGSLNGTVTDKTDAALPHASVTLLDVDTGMTRITFSSSAGEFAFQDLPVGTYSVTAAAPGFNTGKYDKIPVSAGVPYTLPVSLAVSSSTQTVEVVASSISLDTTTAAILTGIPSQVISDAPSNGRDFTQFIQYTPGFAGYSVGGGAGSDAAQVDGVRANQINWQMTAPTTTISGGTSPPSTRAASPASPASSFRWTPSSSSPSSPAVCLRPAITRRHRQSIHQVRNQCLSRRRLLLQPQRVLRRQHSLRTFRLQEKRDSQHRLRRQHRRPHPQEQALLFPCLRAPELRHRRRIRQDRALNRLPKRSHCPYQFLRYSRKPSLRRALGKPLARSALTGPAQPNNYFNPGTENGHSFNPIVHLDYNINQSNQLSVRGYFGDGNQTAPTSGEFSPTSRSPRFT